MWLKQYTTLSGLKFNKIFAAPFGSLSAFISLFLQQQQQQQQQDLFEL